jgi:adenylosuccinate lyase
VMMESVKRGGDRQTLHEIIRVHSHAAAAKVKLEGGANDLIERMAQDERIPLSEEEIRSQLDPKKYTGRSASQVDEFITAVAQPLIDRYYRADTVSELHI